MPENLPGYDREALNWLETRIASWAADPDLIGLDASFVASLQTQINATHEALRSAEIMRDSSKLATFAFKESAKEMREIASQAVASIKSFANRAEDPSSVYVAAHVEPKGSRSKVAPPPPPNINTATLNADGSVTIHFNGKGGTGTTWHVERKISGVLGFVYVGVGDPATKSFTDRALPSGSVRAEYRIYGVRGGAQGEPSYAFVVGFGAGNASGVVDGSRAKAA